MTQMIGRYGKWHTAQQRGITPSERSALWQARGVLASGRMTWWHGQPNFPPFGQALFSMAYWKGEICRTVTDAAIKTTFIENEDQITQHQHCRTIVCLGGLIERFLGGHHQFPDAFEPLLYPKNIDWPMITIPHVLMAIDIWAVGGPLVWTSDGPIEPLALVVR